MAVLAAFALDYVVELWLATPAIGRRFVRHEWTSALIGLFGNERGVAA